MGTRHWDDDEIISSLYGLGPSDGHPAECESCARRLRALVAARERVLELPPVSEGLLTRQRTSIGQRIQAPAWRPGWLSFAFATATAAVVLLAVTLYRPAPVSEPSDAEFFAEVYSIVGTEPLAVEPMHALFEVEQ